jgi:hypothetical protein
MTILNLSEDPKTNVKLWIEALRSDKYEQGQNTLKLSGAETDRHCCLGVAAELIVQAGLAKWNDTPIRGPGNTYHTLNVVGDPNIKATASLPNQFRLLFGLTKKTHLRSSCNLEDSLISLNDDEQFSFAEIAEVLERVVLDDEPFEAVKDAIIARKEAAE